MIPKESDGEPFEDAIARVQRCVGGGITTENDDNDSDLEVIADSITMLLRLRKSAKPLRKAVHVNEKSLQQVAPDCSCFQYRHWVLLLVVAGVAGILHQMSIGSCLCYA